MLRLPTLFLIVLTPGVLLAPPLPSLTAQSADRDEYAAWLATAPTSPLRAVALQPIGAGLTLGPADAEIPLPALPKGREVRVEEGTRGATLDGGDGSRPLPRGRPVRIGGYTLVVSGTAGRGVLTVFGELRGARSPEFYPFDSSRVYRGGLEPPARRGTTRVLAADGVEVDAAEAGTFAVPAGDSAVRLRVLRFASCGGEESELEIYFRDATSGRGSYPAGRFVTLVPESGGRYRLDLNRARNPFCAYSSVYPCPAPWRGNTLPFRVEAGERYQAHSAPPDSAGRWRAVLDLVGGELRFGLRIVAEGKRRAGELCNGDRCQPLSRVRIAGDSLVLEMADYAAAITAVRRGDSLAGAYRNVGNRGPRVIPFRAARGSWPIAPAPAALVGRWDASFFSDFGTSARVFEFRNGSAGLEGTIISNTGDYGHFAGRAVGDSFALSHFDGSFVYLLTGRIIGDTLRGTFHAGARTQTPWQAVRSTGAPHLRPPTAVTGADTTAPFRFAFPDLRGHLMTNRDPRFRGKVVLVDVFGTWCPTCHDAAPALARLYRQYHERGLEVVGLAYEVTGDSAVDARQVRRYRDKYDLPFPLLLAGVNDVDAAAATLPQLKGFTAFPTTVFLGRDGRVRRVHAGFYGPATGAEHRRLVRDFEQEIERLLAEPQA